MDEKEALLQEITRLNRDGVLNDEEFLVLRRLIRESRLSDRTADEFRRLFMTRTRPSHGPGDRGEY